MKTYADELRELAQLLDDNFRKNIKQVIGALVMLISRLSQETNRN